MFYEIKNRSQVGISYITTKHPKIKYTKQILSHRINKNDLNIEKDLGIWRVIYSIGTINKDVK